MRHVVAAGTALAVALLAAGCGGRLAKGPSPLIGGPLAKPFHSTLLLHVNDASRVRVCFHIGAVFSEGHRVRGAETRCSDARLLTALPPSYPVQKNLLSVFPKSVWSVKLPPAAVPHSLDLAVTASNASGTVTNGITLTAYP